MFEREEICMLEGDAQADDTQIRSAHTPHGNILPLGGAGCSTIAAGADQDPARAARVHFPIGFPIRSCTRRNREKRMRHGANSVFAQHIHLLKTQVCPLAVHRTGGFIGADF